MVVVKPPSHWLYQLANVCLFLSYIAPDFLVLRVCLACAGLCFVFWGAFVLNVSVDTIIWNSFFCIVNTLQAVRIIYARRPVKFAAEEHEAIYVNLFEPVGISRLNFKKLIEASLMRTLKAGSIYIEKGNEATNLALIYTGFMEIITAADGEEHAVNDCRPLEFVESPEWSARIRDHSRRIRLQKKKQGNKFLNFFKKGGNNKVKPMLEAQATFMMSQAQLQEISLKSNGETKVSGENATIMNVTIRAKTDCVFFLWPVETLMQKLRELPALAAPISTLLAADVANKLFRQTGRKYQVLRKLEPDSPFQKRQSEELDPERLQIMQNLKRKVDSDAHAIDLKTMFSLAKWRKVLRSGTVIIREGEEMNILGVLCEGSIEAIKEENEKRQYSIEENQLIGSFEFFDSDGNYIAPSSYRSKTACRILFWDTEELRKLCTVKPVVQSFISSLVALDMAQHFREKMSGRVRSSIDEAFASAQHVLMET